MEVPMNRFRITLGAAAGGLLGAAVLPVAVAFADNYEIVPDSSSTETITGLYGLENTALPDVAGTTQGYQEFEVLDTTTGTVVGTFDADEADTTDGLGDTNEELLVTKDLSGPVGTAPGDIPPVGSVIETSNNSDFGTTTVYSDLASTTPGADTISETLLTPTGDVSLPATFDAAAGLAAGSPDAALPGVPLAGGDEIVPDPNSTEQFTAISGLPPYDVAVQGTRLFDVVNSAGAVVGKFDADVTSTSDALGFATQALLVTSDVSGTVGTAAGDTPSVGSVFNTIDYGDGAYLDYYSDLASTAFGGSGVITNAIATPFGLLPIPAPLDAVATESLHFPIPLNDDHIVADPGSAEVFTGVNGLPPYDAAVQGYHLFDVVNSAGTVVGTFDADVANSSDIYGLSTESLLVANVVSGTPGATAGDVPPVGSVIDVSNYAGFETVYTDLASATPGADVISDVFVTPFGDVALPNTFDEAAGLAGDMFATP
jgi:hypothetical protein